MEVFLSEFLVVVVYERALVPESCCEKPDRAYNLEKCQKSQQGPPGKTSGQFNEFLHYRVSLMT